MASTTAPINSTAASNNYADRTVGEFMESEKDVEKDAIVTDIAGRIELGPEVYRFDKFLQDLARHIEPNVSLVESGKGIELLSKVLERLAPEILNRHDISAVTHLFYTRIENAQTLNFKANIKDVANGLRYLSQMSRFMKNEVIAIMDVFFSLDETVWSQQTAPTRNAVYTLLIQLTSTFESELVRVNGMGHKIVDGMTKLAAPEKDPSNLRLVLPFWVTLSSEAEKWRLSNKSFSTMWDSFSRYFPIVIKGTDQVRQTSLVMKDLLRQCFLSSSAYSEWAFPRLLDGLDDITADVKNDVLSTMAACVEKYDTPTVRRYATKIYDGVKYEVLAGEVQNPALIKDALSVIKVLAVRLITDLPPNGENPEFVEQVFRDLCPGLVDPDRKDREKSGKILAAVASSGPVAFEYVVKVSMSILLTVKQSLETTEKKADMMRVFNLILEACPIALNKFDGGSVYRIRAMDALLKFRNRLMDDVYIESMLETESGDPEFIAQRVLAIQGFGLLYSLPLCIAPRSNVLVDGQPTFDTTPFLSEFYRGAIIESLNSILLSNLPQNAQVYEAALDVVQKTAMQDGKIFGESTLKSFLIEIPESVSSADEIEIIIPKLDALTRIACTAPPLTTCFPAGNTKALKRCQTFLIFCQSLIQKVTATTLKKGQADYSTAIIAALFNGMSMFDTALDSEYPGSGEDRYDGVDKISATGPFAETVMALYQLCVVKKQTTDSGVYVGLRKLPCGEFFTSEFLFLVAKCATMAARSKHTPKGSVFPQEVWTLFSSNHDIPEETRNIPQGNCALGPPDKCATAILSLGLLAGIRQDEVLDFNPAEVAVMMIANATSEHTGATFEITLSFIYILQLVVNKFGATKKKLQDGTTIVDTMRRVVSATTTPIVDKEFIPIYQSLSYMASAALQAFDPAATEFIEMMLEGLTASYHDVLFPVRSQMVARSFRVLLSPSEIVSEKNGCKIRPLAKQKLYNLVVPALLKLYPQVISNSDQRQAVLIALAAVLTNLPLSMYQSDAARIIPLVIAGTDVENAGDDDKTKVEAIDILIRLIPQEPKLIEEHLDSIIKRMTDRTHNTFDEPSDASQTCRCKALLCLATLATYVNPEAIIKRKFSVMKELGIALNDVSRPVRHAAVRTKFVWFNVQVNEALAE